MLGRIIEKSPRNVFIFQQPVTMMESCTLVQMTNQRTKDWFVK